MKTTELGIEDGGDMENMYDVRLMSTSCESRWRSWVATALVHGSPGRSRSQKSVNNGHAIRNLPRIGAEMHLHPWSYETGSSRAVAGVYTETASVGKIQVG